MANLTAPSLGFLSVKQQEAILLSTECSLHINEVASMFPFTLLSAENQYAAGCTGCWDMYGNSFEWSDFPEVTGELGFVNPTPVPAPQPKEKSSIFKRIVKVLNTKLF